MERIFAIFSLCLQLSTPSPISERTSLCTTGKEDCNEGGKTLLQIWLCLWKACYLRNKIDCFPHVITIQSQYPEDWDNISLYFCGAQKICLPCSTSMVCRYRASPRKNNHKVTMLAWLHKCTNHWWVGETVQKTWSQVTFPETRYHLKVWTHNGHYWWLCNLRLLTVLTFQNYFLYVHINFY